MTNTEDLKLRIRELLLDLKDSNRAVDLLHAASNDADEHISSFAKNLLTMYDATGPAEFPLLVADLIEQLEVVFATLKGVPTEEIGFSLRNDVCGTPGVDPTPNQTKKSFDFETELKNTVDSVIALFQASLPGKRFGTGINLEDFRVAFSFSRGISYGLTITLASDPKKIICRQIAGSPQELIRKCDTFLSTMLSTLNKNTVKVMN